MGLLNELYITYEKSANLIGIEDNRGKILLPIAHSTQNAQIEVAVNLDGEFKGARTVSKSIATTIIPVTEDSGSRANGIAPHPLFDKLCYMAGDYSKYVAKKNAEDYYKEYIKQLESWRKAGCHRYVEAVYQYIIKGCLIKDLIHADILKVDESGQLSKKVLFNQIPQTEAFIRFYIMDARIEGTGEIWRDKSVYENYIQYYMNQQVTKDIDYITGEYTVCSEKQPSRIRYGGDKAKLISANDNSGFTYRGRFTNRNEALSVGYVPSQKAHNALKWLLERQGNQKHDMSIVVWNPASKEVPDLLQDTFDLLDGDEWLYQADVAEKYAQCVNKAIDGKYADINTQNTDIIILSLEAATPGRLSVTYYQKISGSEFLVRLKKWHRDCAWKMSYKKQRLFYMAPEPEEIVCCAFGNERGGKLEVNEKLMKAQLKHIMPCIIEGRKLPLGLVKAAVNNASNPQNFSAYNRRKIIEVTCALLHKVYHERGRKEFDNMSLDRTRENRSYLYGRLLAVAHKVEYDTYMENERGKRDTNAVRYMHRMTRLPSETWDLLCENLKPYWNKLRPGSRINYEKELLSIYDLFIADEFDNKKKLEPEYLLGYSCELSYLWKQDKKDKKDKKDN